MKKNNKTFFALEAILAAGVLLLAVFMIWERREEDKIKVSVILQNPDDSEWSALKYGIKMAAQQEDAEIFIVSTGDMRNAEEEKKVIEQEAAEGADAVIVQPVPGADTEKILEEAGKKIPIMLVEDAGSGEEEEALPVTGENQYEMGKALAQEVLRDYGGSLQGKTVGLFSKTTDLKMISERERGARETIENAGGKVHWFVAGDFGETDDDFLKFQPQTDVILALDDKSLAKLGEYAESEKLTPHVYGIGHSTEAIYFLDTGVVQCLLVPDQFDIGYKSLSAVTDFLSGESDKMPSQTALYQVVRKETLFSEENQNLLFTMNQ